ncbi:uncharacterized protein LOC127257429 [Andrographis paniculata]|uniref:uncharacterized protein LOC127257429 n=1 Tax=Andrographis paniculata TaxID=175694 RepID=UPI0021E948EA|nr:uncharacterized protein LOC127257429 [Andrographis paniculata]
MIHWLHITLVSISVAILLVVLLTIIKRLFLPKSPDVSDARVTTVIQRFIADQIIHPPPFRWLDHPSLVTEAAENGWSRFSFVAPPAKSSTSVLAACRDGGIAPRVVELGREVRRGSDDFMQRVRLIPTAKKIAAVRMALPLPGPDLGNSSFPPEAYFEITVMSQSGAEKGGLGEDGYERKRGDLEVVKIGKLGEGVKVGSHGRGGNGEIVLSLGVTVNGEEDVRLQVAGSYRRSVGFTSNGSVYLDGTKVADGSREEWGMPNSVVGCGYNPREKKVLFTLNSQLVHEIDCKTEEFAWPLYPILTANVDTTVLVNLGQSPFEFSPANSYRTPNPCFIGHNSPYEDSKDLFSLGRIDSRWQLQRSATRSNNNTVSSLRDLQFDHESDGDLFEIVLESLGRSHVPKIEEF